jgi:hypothetical protein
MLTFLIGLPFLYFLKGGVVILKLNNIFSRLLMALLTLPFMLFLLIYMFFNAIENIILVIIASILIKINQNFAVKLFTPIRHYFYLVPDQINAQKDIIKAILINRINEQNTYDDDDDDKKESNEENTNNVVDNASQSKEEPKEQ